MKLYRTLFGMVATVASFGALNAEEPKLTIGSAAPELKIEHWVQKGKYKEVTKFDKNKVYVVEFWATWCPPCRDSMPHLAELQAKFDSKGVQIVSISDEELDVVTEFLKKDVPGKELTFDELTKSYCLTTDPDGSCKADYLEAANQNGIPCAFIVGKDQKIEWIGHPMEMDEPLTAVVEGKWDRAKYLEQMKEQNAAQEIIQQFVALRKAEKLEESNKLVDDFLATCKTAQAKMEVAMTRFMLLVQEDPSKLASMTKEVLPLVESEPMAIAQICMMVAQEENFKDAELLKLLIPKVEGSIGKLEDRIKPIVYDGLGSLYSKAGDKAKAIASVKKALELVGANAELKGAFQGHLDQLK